jgi:hypothetical protein
MQQASNTFYHKDLEVVGRPSTSKPELPEARHRSHMGAWIFACMLSQPFAAWGTSEQHMLTVKRGLCVYAPAQCGEVLKPLNAALWMVPIGDVIFA